MMRGNWVATTIASMLVLAALAPGAQAGDPTEDCSRVNAAIMPGLGGSWAVCPGDVPQPDVDPDGIPASEIAAWLLAQAPEETPDPDLPETPDLGWNKTTNVTGCPSDRIGWGLERDNRSVAVCVAVDYVVDQPETPRTDPDIQACPEGTDGRAVEAAGWTVGLCVYTDVVVPTRPLAYPANVDTRSCRLSDERQGTDPKVEVGNGGVAFCAAAFVEPHDPDTEPPPVETSLEPCSERSVDPSIVVGGTGVFACVEYEADLDE